MTTRDQQIRAAKAKERGSITIRRRAAKGSNPDAIRLGSSNPAQFPFLTIGPELIPWDAPPMRAL